MPQVFLERSDSPQRYSDSWFTRPNLFERRLLQPESHRVTAWAPIFCPAGWALFIEATSFFIEVINLDLFYVSNPNVLNISDTWYYNRDATTINRHNLFSKSCCTELIADVYIASDGRSIWPTSDIYYSLSNLCGVDKLFFVWLEPSDCYGN